MRQLEQLRKRCYARLADRIPDDSPLKDGDKILCPWCHESMSVRFSNIGHVYRNDEGPSYIDGIEMKHAGSGCGFRPSFDIPISEEEYDEDMVMREGHRSIDFGQSGRELDNADDAAVEEQLRSLGYIVP